MSGKSRMVHSTVVGNFFFRSIVREEWRNGRKHGNFKVTIDGEEFCYETTSQDDRPSTSGKLVLPGLSNAKGSGKEKVTFLDGNCSERVCTLNDTILEFDKQKFEYTLCCFRALHFQSIVQYIPCKGLFLRGRLPVPV